MRVSLALLGLLLGLLPIGQGGIAWAQVSTMELVPATVRYIHPQAVGLNTATFTPDNPAALAWADDDVAGIGATVGRRALPALPKEKQAGRFYGGRLVGDTFGVGLEYLGVDQISPPNQMYDRVSNVQLSLRMGWLALGVGSENVETEVWGLPTELKRAGGGLSLRLWGALYLGVAGYTDLAQAAPLAPIEHRQIDMAGIALRTEGATRWYLAYDVVDQDPLTFQPGEKMRTLTVQMDAGGFVLGLAAGAVDLYGPGSAGPGGDPLSLRSSTLDIGIAPSLGWAVLLRSQRVRLALTAPTPGDESNLTHTLSLTRRF